MKKYVTKFETAAAAHNYPISDIPFVTSVATDPVQNLVCNKTGKHLENIDGVVCIKPEDVHIELVDLGLSVKWADANLGATNADTVESWYGDYYAWGETETKEEYSISNYAHCKDNDMHKLVKYCPTEKQASYWGGTGSADNKLVLDSVDDAPRVQLDSLYRMPTKAECEELLDTEKIDNVWINNYDPTKSEHTPADDGGISGLNGRLFTSKVEGHIGAKIFIPVAGYFSGSTNYFAGSYCYLWSSSLDSDYPSSAWYLFFYSDGISLRSLTRYGGFSVRPVSVAS